MPEMTVEHEHKQGSGRYLVQLTPGIEAEMTYRRTGPNQISIEHTFVPPAFRGQDIAMRLLSTAIDDARKNDLKIVPVCSYVATQFRRHKDWSDVLAG